MARILKFWFRKKRDCTVHVAKTKALISFAVTTKLMCVFVFLYEKCWGFFHDAAHFVLELAHSFHVLLLETITAYSSMAVGSHWQKYN